MGKIIQDLDKYDALGVAELIRLKEIQPIELVDEVIDRIERMNPILNCVCIKTYDLARKLARGPLPGGPFSGLPLLLKDLILLYEGVEITNGCKYFKGFVPKEDSEVITRLKKAGMILIGRTVSAELGCSLTAETVLYGDTRNPWNLEHVAGGSSGGSAAAVAARIFPIADANDGGGSVRIPASNCGLVGLKPSRGRVPMAPQFGDFRYGATICSCVSLTVRDTAAYLDVVSGNVTGDIYQIPNPPRTFLEETTLDPRRLKIGVVKKNPLDFPIDAACMEATDQAAKLCSELGHEVIETEFNFDGHKLSDAWRGITGVWVATRVALAKQAIGRDPKEEDFEYQTWKIIQNGRMTSGIQHAQDIEICRRIGRQIAIDCEPFDIVLTPTLPAPPFKLGIANLNNRNIEKLIPALYAGSSFTMLFNVSGQPAISLPLHWTDDGLPVGVQFIGRYGDEATILRLSAQIEKAKPWFHRKPPICAS